MREMKFEQAMKRLDEIVEELEQGDLPLDRSLKIFEEGIRLSRFCAAKLEEAEKKVEILLGGEEKPFRVEASEDVVERPACRTDREAPE